MSKISRQAIDDPVEEKNKNYGTIFTGIRTFFPKHPGIRKVKDVLDIDYFTMREQEKIGFKVIKKLQNEIITLLNLKKISSVNERNNFTHI